jgi:hypothetical protein
MKTQVKIMSRTPMMRSLRNGKATVLHEITCISCHSVSPQDPKSLLWCSGSCLLQLLSVLHDAALYCTAVRSIVTHVACSHTTLVPEKYDAIGSPVIVRKRSLPPSCSSDSKHTHTLHVSWSRSTASLVLALGFRRAHPLLQLALIASTQK